MRVLLTGASGYVGLHVLRAMLERGHAVTALARAAGKLGPYAEAEGVTVVEADLEDAPRVARALEGQDACVHAALLWGDPGAELEMRDVAASAKLFDAAGRAGVGRAVYVSSVAVHRPFTAEMDETSPLGATDLYGATKAAGELVLRAACAEHGMTGVVVRPGPVVGPPAFPGGSLRTDRRLSAMIADATAGRPLDVVEGDGRQLSDVAGLAKALCVVATIDAPEPAYVCVDREVLTWEWIARRIVAQVGSPSEVRVAPRPGRVGEGPPPRFRTERVEALLGGPIGARDALVAHLRAACARGADGP